MHYPTQAPRFLYDEVVEEELAPTFFEKNYIFANIFLDGECNCGVRVHHHPGSFKRDELEAVDHHAVTAALNNFAGP